MGNETEKPDQARVARLAASGLVDTHPHLPQLPEGTKTGGHPIETRLLLLIQQRGGFAPIFEHIVDGKPVKWIAEQYGVSRALMSKVLNAPERKPLLREARIASASSHAEDATEIADQMAPDKNAAAKARVQVAHRQWLAQSLDRDQFGKQADVQITQNFGTLYLDSLRTRQVPRPVIQARIEEQHVNDLPGSEARGLLPTETEAAPKAETESVAE